jgi:hypothetical protein
MHKSFGLFQVHSKMHVAATSALLAKRRATTGEIRISQKKKNVHRLRAQLVAAPAIALETPKSHRPNLAQ